MCTYRKPLYTVCTQNMCLKIVLYIIETAKELSVKSSIQYTLIESMCLDHKFLNKIFVWFSLKKCIFTHDTISVLYGGPLSIRCASSEWALIEKRLETDNLCSIMQLIRLENRFVMNLKQMAQDFITKFQ